MLLYNVTSSIEPAAASAWLTYMREVHMPEVIASGYFIKSQLLRVLNEEDGGHTYAAQYYCVSQAQLEAYQQHAAPALRADMEHRFSGQYVSFRTVLEII